MLFDYNVIASPVEANPLAFNEINLCLLSVDEAVQYVVNSKKDDYIESYGQEDFDLIYKKKLIDRYTKLEIAFRAENLPKNWDSYEPAGGIKQSIDTNQIDAFVQEKFSALRKAGLLLYRSEFEQQEDATKFRKPGKGRNEDLTRMWGAEYLRKKLASTEHYSVPRTFIVVENDANTVPITVSKDYKSLVISACDIQFAEVVVENIGNCAATCSKEKHGWMRSIGYVDYADDGNIREDLATHEFYVVDTEWQSLDGVMDIVDEDLSSLDPSIKQLRAYASDRFNALHPETSSSTWKKNVLVRLDQL